MKGLSMAVWSSYKTAIELNQQANYFSSFVKKNNPPPTLNLAQI